MEGKMTHFRICCLLKEGKAGEIPSGYNIVWAGEGEPRRLLDERVDGRRVTFLRNPIGGLKYMDITADAVPLIAPTESCPDDGKGWLEPLEYGDVVVRTSLELTDIRMCFKKGVKGHPATSVDDWVKWVSDFKFKSKDSITFDISARCGEGKIGMYHILPEECRYTGEDEIEMKVICDYFVRK